MMVSCTFVSFNRHDAFAERNQKENSLHGQASLCHQAGQVSETVHHWNGT